MARTILIVDDDNTTRDIFHTALEKTPYEIFSAISGEDCLEKVGMIQPDLIFLDLQMPGIDGLETMRKFREMDIDAHVYIVTAFMPEYLDRLAQAAKTGSFGLAQKPMSIEQIRSIASGVLEKPEVI